MTVETLNRSTELMPANGATRNWPFTFFWYDSSTIKVIYRSAAGIDTEVPVGDYTLTEGAGNTSDGYAGGTITYPISPTAAKTDGWVYIYRELPLTQTGIDLSTTSGFDPRAMERALDEAVMRDQQLSEAVPITVVDDETIQNYIALSFATLAAAGASEIYPVRRCYIRGHTTDGDGGAGWYDYVASEPASTTGKFQDAAGYWYKLDARLFTFAEQHGCFPATYADAALDNAIEFCLLNGSWLLVSGIHYVGANHVFNDTLRVRGIGPHLYTGTYGLRNLSGFRIDAGYGFEALDDGGEDQSVGECVFENLLFVDEGSTTAPANRQSWDTVPMLLSHRSPFWTIRNCVFDGANRRLIGYHLGEGNTCWNSRFDNVRTMNCFFGFWVGGTNDATGNVFTDCTTDNNLHGGVFQNPRGGTWLGGSMEYNDFSGGFIYSTGSRASNFAIRDTYLYANGQDASAITDANLGAIVIGGELPFSDYTVAASNLASTTEPWACMVINPYGVNDALQYAVISSGQRRCIIELGLLQADTKQVKLTAAASSDTRVTENWAQGSTAQDTVDHTNGFLITVEQRGDTNAVRKNFGDLEIDIGTEFKRENTSHTVSGRWTEDYITFGSDAIGYYETVKLGTLTALATAGGWSDVFDCSTDIPNSGAGTVIIEGRFKHTSNLDGEQGFRVKIEHKTKGANAGTYMLEKILYTPEIDNRDFRISGSKLQVYCITNNAYISAEQVVIDTLFSD